MSVSRTLKAFLAAGAMVGLVGLASAQLPESPFRSVDATTLPLDRNVWTLHFAYMTPKIVTIQTPDQGMKTVWYMPYFVYNKSGSPRNIVPEFELVTKDPDSDIMSSLDEAQPSVVDAIRKMEDPDNKLNYLTSVSISKIKIPVAKPDTYPQSQAIHGIAVWLDVPAKANPNNFSVYVTGLSDGLAKKEIEDTAKGETKVVVSRKTLRLDFKRPVGSAINKTDDIKINDNNGLGAETWLYRESSTSTKKKAAAK